MLIGAYPFVLFSKYMFSHKGALCKSFIDIENAYRYNGAIKAYMQTYISLLISSICNVIAVTPITNADYYSLAFSYFYLLFTAFFFGFSIVFVFWTR